MSFVITFLRAQPRAHPPLLTGGLWSWAQGSAQVDLALSIRDEQVVRKHEVGLGAARVGVLHVEGPCPGEAELTRSSFLHRGAVSRSFARELLST